MSEKRWHASELTAILDEHVRRRAHVIVLVLNPSESDVVHVSQAAAFAGPLARMDGFLLMLDMHASALASLALQTTEPQTVLERVRDKAAAIIATDPRVTSTEGQVSG